jgi:phosphohistidine phosphatase
MPTSAVVEFNFDTKAWSDIGEIRPAKVVFDYPKK